MILWIAAAALVAGTLAMVLAPLLRRAPAAPLQARDYDIEVYRDQLAELERDRERGVIASGEAEAARVEIERRLLAAARTRDAAAAAGASATASVAASAAAGSRRLTAAVLALLIGGGAVALYLGTGRPDLPGQPFAARQAGGARIAAADIAAMAARLEASPDDLAGWIELARAYRGVERFADAARAFARARDLAGDRPIILSAYGEALTMAAGGRVTQEAKAAFDAVLARQPGDPRARFYLGLARAQADDAAGALDIWIALEAASPPGSPWRANLGRQMKALADQAGIDLAARRRDRAAAPAEAPGPGRADIEAAQNMNPGERTAMIRSMVDRLAARLEENPDDLAGWKQLGRSYLVLDEPAKAAGAYAEAAALAPGDVDLLIDYGQALLGARAAGAPLPLRFVAIMRDILALDPGNAVALWHLGQAAAESGQAEQAAAHWRALLDRMPEDAPLRAMVEERIEALPGGK